MQISFEFLQINFLWSIQWPVIFGVSLKVKVGIYMIAAHPGRVPLERRQLWALVPRETEVEREEVSGALVTVP